MVVSNISVTVNVAADIEAKKQLLNYNGEPLKEGEVLVPMIKDDLFIKECVTNPDSITRISRNGKSFRAVLVAVPAEYAAVVTSDNNLEVNEELGHYTKKNSVSLNELMDEYEFEIGVESELDKKLAEQDAMDMFREYVAPLLAKSPKHAYAYLLRLTGVQGKEFETLMQLGHDAANTVRKEVDNIVSMGIKAYDVDALKANKSRNAEYYLQAAYELLDQLINLI